MPAKRKLFLGHASELAHRLVRSVRPNALVSDFAKSYSKRYRRHGVVDDPARLRELEATLGREAILVMLSEVRRLLPSAVGLGGGRALDPDRQRFAKMFSEEFGTALERALDWPPADFAAEREAFARDLLMYEGTPESEDSSSARESGNRFSPFYDRCALLLDPSMMDSARRAAATFEKELMNAAAQLVTQIGKAGDGKKKSGLPSGDSAKRRPQRKPGKSKPAKPRPNGKTRAGRRKRAITRKH